MKLIAIVQLYRIQCRLEPQLSKILLTKSPPPPKIRSTLASRSKITNTIQSHCFNSYANSGACRSFDASSSSFHMQSQYCCFSSSQGTKFMKNDKPRSAYSILSLRSNATKEEIKTSFRKVCLLAHCRNRLSSIDHFFVCFCIFLFEFVR